MKNIKFKCFDKEQKKWSNTPLDYQIKDINFYTDYIWCQHIGFNDAENTELYQGDVIELHITPELMKTAFNESTIGQYCSNHPDITHIVLEFNMQNILSMNYTVYQKINDEIDRNKNGNAKIITSGEDSTFPRYLVKKGAKYIGSTVENPALLKKNMNPKN